MPGREGLPGGLERLKGEQTQRSGERERLPGERASFEGELGERKGGPEPFRGGPARLGRAARSRWDGLPARRGPAMRCGNAPTSRQGQWHGSGPTGEGGGCGVPRRGRGWRGSMGGKLTKGAGLRCDSVLLPIEWLDGPFIFVIPLKLLSSQRIPLVIWIPSKVLRNLFTEVLTSNLTKSTLSLSD